MSSSVAFRMVGEMCFESAFDFVDSTFDSGDTSSDSGEVNSVSPFVPSRCSGLFGRVAIELARGGDGSESGGLRAASRIHAAFAFLRAFADFAVRSRKNARRSWIARRWHSAGGSFPSGST